MTMTKKIISVVLLSIGSLAIFGHLYHAVELFFLGEEYSEFLWDFPYISIGMLLIGAYLWSRWRLLLGIISIVYSLPLKLGIIAFWSYRKGYLAFSDLSDLKRKPAEILSTVTVVVIAVIIGIILITWQKYRDRAEMKSKTAA